MGINQARDTRLKGVVAINNSLKDNSGIRLSTDKGVVIVHNFTPNLEISKADALLFGIYCIQEALGLDEMPEDCDLISLMETYREMRDAQDSKQDTDNPCK